MGNTLGCSASGERLVSAARDGDEVEARMLLELSPALARYSTFGGLNSPLHFAAAKGHNEIVAMLLENGADVNSRNYCGQTALMQACRHGHLEVVQTLLIYKCNVTKADYLSGRTALHFAAVEGHVRCIRILVVDYIPSVTYESSSEGQYDGSSTTENSASQKLDRSALSRFINKAADGGLTALHMAALNGHHECVRLLLDLHANVSAVTFHYGSSINLIGAGSTTLHYAASGGNLKCCQILISRGASRLTLNCNGWLPVDIARVWGRHWLEPLLAPNSEIRVPRFPLSGYFALPLQSILNIARECGLQSSTASSDDSDLCAICLEKVCTVSAEGCAHEFCVKCSLYLCTSTNVPSETVDPPGSVPCPLCRNGIVSFVKIARNSGKELKSNQSVRLCSPCMLQPRALDSEEMACSSELRRTRTMTLSSELICSLSCSPFPSISLTSCSCDDDPCPHEPQLEGQDQSPRPSQSATNCELDKLDNQRDERATCTSMFWSRRNCQREHQCNAEINA